MSPARLAFLTSVGVAVAASAVTPAAVDRHYNRTTGGSPRVSASARALHARLRVVDLHADALLWGRDLLARNARGHVDLPRLIEGNVALQVFGLVTNTARGDTGSRDKLRQLAIAQRWPLATLTSEEARARYQIERFDETERGSKGRLVPIRSQADLRALLERRASDPACVGGLLGLEGAHALQGDLAAVRRLADAGLRMVGLAHFFDNEFAGSAHGRRKGGLSPRGRELIRLLEERRVIVDLAHAAPATITDVLGVAQRPVVVSHTGVRGTCDNARNLSDGQLRAVATGGGLIGIGYWRAAVCGDDVRAIARAVRHAATVAGVEHVALGSDFDGAVTTPIDAAGLAAITQALMGVGFEERDIRRIMGENALAFLDRALPSS